jgi:hypothetical protein
VTRTPAGNNLKEGVGSNLDGDDRASDGKPWCFHFTQFNNRKKHHPLPPTCPGALCDSRCCISKVVAEVVTILHSPSSLSILVVVASRVVVIIAGVIEDDLVNTSLRVV